MTNRQTEKENAERKALGETRLSSEEVFAGELLHIFRDKVALPNGNTATREINRHVGAVCMVPLTSDGRLVVERQFRYPLDQVITEIPAGKLNGADEDRLEAAKRELKEETGLTADEWTDWGDFFPAPAYSNERITMYLARGLHGGSQQLDADEFLHVQAVPVAELLAEVLAGQIVDGKTQIAVLRCARLLSL